MLIAAAGVSVFTLVGVLIGLVVWRDPGVPRSDAAAPDTPAASAATLAGTPGELNPASREASVGGVSMRLPDDPYTVYSDPLERRGTLAEIFLASARVHADYDGRRDWSAVVGVGPVGTSAESNPDLEQLADRIVRQLADQFFGGHRTAIRGVSVADHAVSGRPGLLLTAQVHYRAEGLPSRYDAVNVVVVRQDDGSVVAAFSSVPDDAPPELARLAEESLASLHIR